MTRTSATAGGDDADHHHVSCSGRARSGGAALELRTRRPRRPGRPAAGAGAFGPGAGRPPAQRPAARPAQGAPGRRGRRPLAQRARALAVQVPGHPPRPVAAAGAADGRLLARGRAGRGPQQPERGHAQPAPGLPGQRRRPAGDPGGRHLPSRPGPAAVAGRRRVRAAGGRRPPAGGGRRPGRRRGRLRAGARPLPGRLPGRRPLRGLAGDHPGVPAAGLPGRARPARRACTSPGTSSAPASP